MKYRYTGTEEKHFPELGELLKPGDISKETDKAVNHPELEPVKEDEQQEDKAKKKQN